MRFAVVSGLGWGLDFLAFGLLIHLESAPFVANAVGASLAIIWVYAASVRRIFRYDGKDHHHLFAIYAVYQVAGITAASWVVAALVDHSNFMPLLAKAAVTPVTFLANYVFMSWLTRVEPGGALIRDH